MAQVTWGMAGHQRHCVIDACHLLKKGREIRVGDPIAPPFFCFLHRFGVSCDRLYGKIQPSIVYGVFLFFSFLFLIFSRIKYIIKPPCPQTATLFYKKKQEPLQYLECDFIYLDHSKNLNNPKASCKAEKITAYANFQFIKKKTLLGNLV